MLFFTSFFRDFEYSHVSPYIRFGIYSFFRNFEIFDFDSAYIREYTVNFGMKLGVFSTQSAFPIKNFDVKMCDIHYLGSLFTK